MVYSMLAFFVFWSRVLFFLNSLLDGVKVEAVAVQSISSIPICSQAWKCLLQAVVGTEQAIHSGASYSREMQPIGEAIVLHPPC